VASDRFRKGAAATGFSRGQSILPRAERPSTATGPTARHRSTPRGKRRRRRKYTRRQFLSMWNLSETTGFIDADLNLNGNWSAKPHIQNRPISLSHRRTDRPRQGFRVADIRLKKMTRSAFAHVLACQFG
jgi:hypothetical protein